jgi:hypothetical protein
MISLLLRADAIFAAGGNDELILPALETLEPVDDFACAVVLDGDRCGRKRSVLVSISVTTP